MRKIALLFVMFIGLSMNAQKHEKLEEYTASNGITYKIGDEIKLGRGSDTNGRFVYVNMAGWGAVMGATNNAQYNAEQNRLGAANAELIVVLKKIKKYDTKRFKGVYFTVGGGNITNYNIDIENAISVCEVENCKSNELNLSNPAPDKYEQLKTLKQLFDDGVLTEEEYNTEKKKILDN